MDEQRALLDQLMGMNRDGDREETILTDFRDDRVCKHYLAGLCIHDLFQNTKMDLGECAKYHIPELKEAYDLCKKDYRYERSLEQELLKYHRDIQRKIHQAQQRLDVQDSKEDNNNDPVSSATDSAVNMKTAELLEITAEIQEAIEQVEILGLDGEVFKALEFIQKVDELKVKQMNVQSQINLAGGSTRPGSAGDAQSSVNQKLRVCDVCGSFLSIFDSDRRLADHFGGKLHLGYLQIRKKIEEIRKSRGEPEEIPLDSTGHQNYSNTPSRRDSSKSNSSSDRYRSRSRDKSSSRNSSRYQRSDHRSSSYRRRDRENDHHRDRYSNRDRSQSPHSSSRRRRY